MWTGGGERPTEVTALASGTMEYRWERRGPGTVVVLHGGHMRAGLALGEEVFAEGGYTVLAPSRPGYGRTPPTTGTTPAGFADSVRDLCDHLGIERVEAVVGVSAGGPWAVAAAARHPELFRRVVLQSAVGPLPWPDRRTRLGAQLAFSAVTERATWALVRQLIRRAPRAGLRTMLRDLSVLPAAEVAAGLREEHRRELLDLFSRMRSGRGFLNDLRTGPDPAVRVDLPVLVIASRDDATVPFTHAQALADRHGARLLESRAASHLIWFGPDWPELARQIATFLDEPPMSVGG